MSSFRERKERGSEPAVNKDDEEARVLRRLSSFQLAAGDTPKLQRAPAQPLTNGTAPKVQSKEYCFK